MSIKIGDLDLANEVLELHFQVIRTQMILDSIINANPNLLGLTDQQMQSINDRALGTLQQKFPNMGIQRNI